MDKNKFESLLSIWDVNNDLTIFETQKTINTLNKLMEESVRESVRGRCERRA